MNIFRLKRIEDPSMISPAREMLNALVNMLALLAVCGLTLLVTIITPDPYKNLAAGIVALAGCVPIALIALRGIIRMFRHDP